MNHLDLFYFGDVVGANDTRKFFGIFFDNIIAKPVKSANADMVGERTDNFSQAPPHRDGAGFGKCQRQNILRPDLGLTQNIGNAEREYLGLTRPRAGYHHHRALHRVHGFSLRLIQLFVVFLKFSHYLNHTIFIKYASAICLDKLEIL